MPGYIFLTSLRFQSMVKTHQKTKETKFLIRPEKVTLSLEASVTKERQIYVARLQCKPWYFVFQTPTLTGLASQETWTYHHQAEPKFRFTRESCRLCDENECSGTQETLWMALAMFVCKEHGRGCKRVRNFCTMKGIYLWCQRIRQLKKKKKRWDGSKCGAGWGWHKQLQSKFSKIWSSKAGHQTTLQPDSNDSLSPQFINLVNHG